MKDMTNKYEAQMKEINELTGGAPYDLWLSAGGVYVVMDQKITSVLAHAVQNIFEANRMSYRNASC